MKFCKKQRLCRSLQNILRLFATQNKKLVNFEFSSYASNFNSCEIRGELAWR